MCFEKERKKERMGISNSKEEEDEGRELREKINELEDEVKEVKKRREKEALKYKHDLWLFACKEEEWKQDMAKMKMTLEVALEKWKKLYHEIKLELDHLILHTLLQGFVFHYNYHILFFLSLLHYKLQQRCR